LPGGLAEGINLHFHIRPRIMFTGQDAALQSAATAARGIKDGFTRSIEHLSTDDDRAVFATFVMNSDGNAEASMRFAFLDLITIRVAAVKRPGQGWDATVDSESVRLSEGCSASGCHSIAAIAPVLQFASAAVAAAACGDLENLEDAKCSICLCSLFESSGVGSVSIDAREMKCPGRHTFHAQCAYRWFVDEKHSSCPYCRHDFSVQFCDCISVSLEHQVEATGSGFTVHWNESPNQRLAALNVLQLLPQETPFGRTTAYALLWSCFDAAAGVADVALRCGRLSLAIEGMQQEEIGLWCSRLVEAFAVAETSAIAESVAMAMCDLAEEEDICACLVAAGACVALVEALKVAEEDDTIDEIAYAMVYLAASDEGRAALIAAGACGALVEAIKIAEEDDTALSIARALSRFVATVGGAANEVGCAALIAAGACGALVQTLKIVAADGTRDEIAFAMVYLASCEEGHAALVAAGACGALVQELWIAEADEWRGNIAYAISVFAKSVQGRIALDAAGVCDALVVAFKTGLDVTKVNVAWAMMRIAENMEGHQSLVRAGAYCALVEELKIVEAETTKGRIAYAMGILAKKEEGCASLVAAGACVGLVQALYRSATKATQDDIKQAMLCIACTMRKK